MRNELRKYSIKKTSDFTWNHKSCASNCCVRCCWCCCCCFFFYFTLVAKVQFVFEYSNFVFCKNILRLRRSCFRVPLLPEFDWNWNWNCRRLNDTRLQETHQQRGQQRRQQQQVQQQQQQATVSASQPTVGGIRQLWLGVWGLSFCFCVEKKQKKETKKLRVGT